MAKKNFKKIEIFPIPDSQSVIKLTNADQVELDPNERLLLINDKDTFVREIPTRKNSHNTKTISITNVVNTDPLQLVMSDTFEFRSAEDMVGQLARFQKDGQIVDLIIESREDILTFLDGATLVSTGDFHYILGGSVSYETAFSDRVIRSDDGITWQVISGQGGDHLRRKNATAYYYNGFIYYFGGVSSTSTYNNEVWRANVDGGTGALTWALHGTNALFEFEGMSAEPKDDGVDNSVLIAGGLNGSTYTDNILYINDPDLPQSAVSQASKLSEPKAFGGLMYIAERDTWNYHGGEDATQVYNTTDSLYEDDPTAPTPIIQKFPIQRYTHNQLAASAAWVIPHGLNTANLVIEVYEGNQRVVPASLTFTDANNTTVNFNSAITGYAIVKNMTRYTKQTFASSIQWQVAHGLAVTSLEEIHLYILNSDDTIINPGLVTVDVTNITIDFKSNEAGSIYFRSVIDHADNRTLGQFNNTEIVSELNQTASDAALNDRFGRTIDIKNNILIVGAAERDTGGGVYTYDIINGAIQNEIRLSGDVGGADFFGGYTDFDGTYLVVGSDREVSSTGAVYVYERVGSGWSTAQKFLGSNVGDSLGAGVGIDDIWMVAGSLKLDNGGTNRGGVNVYKRTGSTWAFSELLTQPTPVDNDFYGAYVSVSGNYIVVGNICQDNGGTNKGSAYVYHYNGTNWTTTTVQELQEVVPGDNRQFGTGVSISGDYLSVGGASPKKLHVYERTALNTWDSTVQVIDPPDAIASVDFGNKISKFDGDNLLIADRFYPLAGGRYGAVFLYKRQQAGLWTFVTRLDSPDPAVGSKQFAVSIALDQNENVIGVGEVEGSQGGFSQTGSIFLFQQMDMKNGHVTNKITDHFYSDKLSYNVTDENGEIYIPEITMDKNTNTTSYRYSAIPPRLIYNTEHGFQDGVELTQTWDARSNFSYIKQPTNAFITGGEDFSNTEIPNPNKVFRSIDGLEYENLNATGLPSLPVGDATDTKTPYQRMWSENSLYVFIDKNAFVSFDNGVNWTQTDNGYFVPQLLFFGESWKTLATGDIMNSYPRNTEILYDSGLTGDFQTANPKPTEIKDYGHHRILMPGYQHPDNNSLVDQISLTFPTNFKVYEDTTNVNNSIVPNLYDKTFSAYPTNFATDNNWIAGNSATLTNPTNNLSVENTVPSGYAELSLITEIGVTYRVTVDFDKDSSASRAQISAVDSAVVFETKFDDSYLTGSLTLEFDALSTSTEIRLIGGTLASEHVLYDNFNALILARPLQIAADELSGHKLLVRKASDIDTVIEKKIRNNEALDNGTLVIYLDRRNLLDAVSVDDWFQISLNRQERHTYITSIVQNTDNKSIVTFDQNNDLIGDIYAFNYYYQNKFLRYISDYLRENDSDDLTAVLQSEMNRLRVQGYDVQFNDAYKIDSFSLDRLLFQLNTDVGELDHRTLRQLAISGFSDITSYNGTKKGVDNFLTRVIGQPTLTTIAAKGDPNFPSLSSDIVKIQLDNLVSAQWFWDNAENEVYYDSNGGIVMNLQDSDVLTTVGEINNSFVVVANRTYVSRPYRLLEHKVSGLQELITLEQNFAREFDRLETGDKTKVFVFSQANLLKFNYIVKNIKSVLPFYVTPYYYT